MLLMPTHKHHSPIRRAEVERLRKVCSRGRGAVTKEGRGGGWRGLLTMVICCRRGSHARNVPH